MPRLLLGPVRGILAENSYKVFPAAITPSQASRFSLGYCKFTDPVISDLVELVKTEYPDVTTLKPSYCRVEDRVEGHPWHRDTGSTGHMRWCYVSARLLLSDPGWFKGGGCYFRDDPKTPHDGYCDLMVYTAADHEHMVCSHSGTREVLLMFFAKASEL